MDAIETKKAEGARAQVNLPHVFRDAAKAIMQRDVESLRSLIRNVPEAAHRTGPHPNWGGRPQLLHVAVGGPGLEEAVSILLDAGADPSGENESYDGWSPLMLAVHWKREEICEVLLQRGARVGLYEALMLEDDRRAFPLIDAMVVGERRAERGYAPAFCADCQGGGAVNCAEGVDVSRQKDKYGRTAMDTVAAKGNREVAAMLAQAGLKTSADNLARLGDLAGLKLALGRKKAGAELLKPAIEGKQMKVVQWLLEQGVDVNQPDEKGVTALHNAAWEGNLPMVKLLVKQGANVHAEDDEYGATPAGWGQHAAQNFNRAGCLEVTGYLQKQEEKKWSVKAAPAHQRTHKVAVVEANHGCGV